MRDVWWNQPYQTFIHASVNFQGEGVKLGWCVCVCVKYSPAKSLCGAFNFSLTTISEKGEKKKTLMNAL